MKTRMRNIMLGEILVILLTAVAGYSDLSDGLVAYYPFSGNANDESGNGNNGLLGDPTLTADRFDTPSSAYFFDGTTLTDYIVVNDDPSLHFTNASFSVWIRPQNPTPPRGYVFSKDFANGGTCFQLSLDRDDLVPSFAVNQWGNLGEEVTYSPGLTAHQWYHLIGTYDGQDIHLYIDGSLGNTVHYTGGLNTNHGKPLVIGQKNYLAKPPSEWDWQYTGEIDELRVYNRALSQSEIQQLAGMAEPTPEEQIQEILDFVDESVAEGTLVGVGPGSSAKQKLDAFINMLEEAQSLIDTELFAEAYCQVQDAYGKCDGQSPPPDFVAGEATSELAELIQTLMESIQGVPGVTESARMFIISVHANYPLDLHTMLEANPTLRYNYIEAHLTLSQFSVTASDEDPERVVLYNFCRDFVSDSLQVAGHLYFDKQRSYDPASTPTIGFIRERFYRTWKDALPLTPERLVEITQVGNFSPQQAEIFTKFAVLVMDNASLDADQLDVIDAMLSLIPQSLHDLAAIGVVDQIGSFPPEMGWWDFFDGKGGEINIFSTPVGAIVEQHFPDDVAPWLSDFFTIALAHETNHIVDSWTVSGNSELASRRQALIQAAGTDHMNYLRSMLPDGFFVDLPQEFFASIANQWFSNSARTLQLGLNRFDNSLRHPINQALFFAEVYSGGGTQTWFFTTDTAGQITRFPVPLQRDTQGRINVLTVGETDFQFELDAAGDVTNYVETPNI